MFPIDSCHKNLARIREKLNTFGYGLFPIIYALIFSKAVSKEKLKEYLSEEYRVKMESNKFKPIKNYCSDIGNNSTYDPKFDCDYNN